MATLRNSATHSLRSSAVRRTPADLHSVIEFLAEHLGRRLLAMAIGVDHRTIERWIADPERQPRFDAETRLRAAYQVFQELQPFEAPVTIRAWFMGMNPQLDDLSPAEAIRDDRSREVMSAARAFINAG